MSKLRLLCALLALAACGGNHTPKGPQEKLPDVPIIDQPSKPTPNSDTAPPEVSSFRQVGLDQLIIEFSEPIKQIDKMTLDAGIEEFTWDVNRRILTFKLNASKIDKLSGAKIQLIKFIDDANLQNRVKVTIPVDATGPAIQGVKVIDSHNMLVTFDEDAIFSEASIFLVDSVFNGKIVSPRSDKKQVIIEVSDIDLTTGESHQLTVTNISDAHGNISVKSRFGFAQGLDTHGPDIVSIKQLPTKYHVGESIIDSGTMYRFELEFSEFVVDAHDLGDSDIIKADKLDPLREIVINGKTIPDAKGAWTPRKDHRGGTLEISVYHHSAVFQNKKVNTLELYLMDAAGNGNSARTQLIVDSAAPEFKGDYKKATQCAMSSMQSFRCEISEPDVKEAFLSPDKYWPEEDYSVTVTTEESGGVQRHWLNFSFQKVVPEAPIVGIMTVDLMDNTNYDADITSFFFKPATTSPELIRATAFNNSVLELEFSKDVGLIDSVLVDGISKEFDLKFVDNALDPLRTPSVAIHFAEPVMDGIHDIEIRGAKRVRNSLAITLSAKIAGLNNRIQSILQSSITQEPDLERTTDLRFEVTRPFSENLEAFVGFSEDKKTPFSDFTLLSEGKTSRGTYAIRLHKETAAGLLPNLFDQSIILQLPGQLPTKPVSIGWPTREPALMIKEKARPDGFKVATYYDVDLDSLDLEIVSRNEMISIKRSWISNYENSAKDFGFKVSLPADVRLKSDPYYYSLRVKGARTSRFGIMLSKPYELYLTVQ